MEQKTMNTTSKRITWTCILLILLVPAPAVFAQSSPEQACMQGDMEACLVAGDTTSSDTDAAVYFQRACHGGLMYGCIYLAMMYERGLGVSFDNSQAASLYQYACDGGALPACTNLAAMYIGGTGLPQDLPRATGLFGHACNGGELNACALLGAMYERGMGVPFNPVQAQALYRMACEGGFSSACANVR